MRDKWSKDEFDAKIAAVSEIDWARLAAFIDGEGTIHISRNDVAKSSVTPVFTLFVVLGNTDLRLINWLVDTFTGIVCKAKKRSSKWKDMYQWRQASKRAEVIVEHCLPYLICKREQAETALAFRKLFPGCKIGRLIADSTIDARNECRKKMQALNLRGEEVSKLPLQ